MRPSQICSCMILIVFPIFLLISILTSNNEDEHVQSGPVSGSFRIPKTKFGIIYDLFGAYFYSAGKLDDEENFIVSGFVFHKKLPILVKRITRNFRPKNTWVLYGKNSTGTITLQNVQREQPRMEPVLVVVTYYVSWNWEASGLVTVTGRSFDRDTNEVEEESEKLPDITGGEPTKKGYCRKIVYFGPVDEIVVEGQIEDTDDAVVLIENVKVVVGVSEFDEEPELNCKILLEQRLTGENYR